jgi:prepilin-type N-terminal cleavage/methylation domain-containing protein
MGRQASAGFTLIEVLIAIVTVAIGLLGVASLMSGAIGGNSKAMAIANATRVAADHLETLATLPYDDPWLQDVSGDGLLDLRNPLPPSAPGVQDRPDPVARPADHTLTSPDDNYTIYWNIATDQPITDTKTIMVIVTSTGLGQRRTVALQHIVRNH